MISWYGVRLVRRLLSIFVLRMVLWRLLEGRRLAELMRSTGARMNRVIIHSMFINIRSRRRATLVLMVSRVVRI